MYIFTEFTDIKHNNNNKDIKNNILFLCTLRSDSISSLNRLLSNTYKFCRFPKDYEVFL